MSSTKLLCLVLIGLMLAGCGGRDRPPSSASAYDRYFAEKPPAPKDRTVRLAADPAVDGFELGSAIELNVMISNMASRTRALPLGVKTEAGPAYTFFSALVCDEAGRIERLPLASGHESGPLVWIELDKYSTQTEPISLGQGGVFDKPGVYRVVLFYSVDEEQVPGDKKPDWTGTVWTLPIRITIE
jgi:hypothetical protein